MASSKHLIVGNTNPRINSLISAESGNEPNYSCHYNSSEEMFLKFKRQIVVPSMPIHHDVRNPVAGQQYSEAIESVVKEVLQSLPGLLNGLKYYFDPSDVHRPTFYQMYKVQDLSYIYQLKFDLTFHPSHHEVLEQGDNDYSPKFKTDKLIIEADIIPIEQISKTNGFPTLVIEQSISDTWIGETGRGYFVQGIWLDRELTKFFSKLFMPEGQRSYPFYPISCKYQAICQTLNVFSPESRRKRMIAHHNIRKYILKYLDTIESSLRHSEFNESMEAYQLIKQKIPEKLQSIWSGTKVSAYLNDDEMREYLVEDALH